MAADLSEAPSTDTRLLVLYDADCGICTRTASILRRLDGPRHRLRLLPLQRRATLADLPGLPSEAELGEALHARDDAGRWFAGGAAAIRIADEVPVLRPVAWAARLPGVPAMVDVAYRLVARNRQTLSRLLGEQACRLPSRDAVAGSDPARRSSPER